jgi:hypothetical protein
MVAGKGISGMHMDSMSIATEDGAMGKCMHVFVWSMRRENEHAELVSWNREYGRGVIAKEKLCRPMCKSNTLSWSFCVIRF